MAETCQLAVGRIQWLHGSQTDKDKLPSNPYASVDPAPPSSEQDIESLKHTLTNAEATLFARYCAMFALRNQATAEAALALTEGAFCLAVDH